MTNMVLASQTILDIVEVLQNSYICNYFVELGRDANAPAAYL